MAAAGAVRRHAGLQRGRGGRAGPAGADARRSRRRTRSSSSTTSTRTRRSRSSTGSRAELPAVRGLRNDLGRGVLNAMKAGIAASTGPYVLISMADGSDEPHVVDPMVALARDGADVVSASRYMRGGHQVGGPPLKRLMSRTAGLTLHWFAGVPTHDPTNNFKLYSRRFLDTRHDREHGRLRARARADGQGDARRPPRRRGPDDLARPDRRAEQLQAPQVAAALPALVLGGLRRAAVSIARRRPAER